MVRYFCLFKNGVENMNILVVGLNYRTAPVEIRERFSVSEEALNGALRRLTESSHLLESVVVSTCNRTEIYAVTNTAEFGRDEILSYLENASGVKREVFLPYLYIHSEETAVRHLLRVTSGLDSMVLGETQILGQVREAFLRAQQAGVTGSMFNNLFKRSITFAKYAHSETEIGRHAVSVSYAAVELAKKIFEELNDKTILVIGAGKMSELTAKHLYSSGARRVLVVNRTFERAKELADKFEGHALELKSLDLALKEADIVVSSTGAENYVVDKQQIAAVMKQRRNRPLFLIDIAVPRDLDPEINKLANVYLYDIDDLEGVIAANLEERHKEAEKISVLIEQEVTAFKQWQTEQAAVPMISALRVKGNTIQKAVMESLQNKLPDLSDRDLHLLQKHTNQIINQLLHEPIKQLKEMAHEPQAELYLETFSRLFGLAAEEQISQQPTPASQPDGEPKKEPILTVVGKTSQRKNPAETKLLGGMLG